MIPVVAIDGPAASGKSSTGREVARRLGYLHVDSGALYRGVTLVALDLDPAGGAPAEQILAAAEARGLALRPGNGEAEVVLDGSAAEARIRSAEVTAAVSAVSALAPVREWVTRRLRALAGDRHPLVVDGRDIGTVVFPDAPVKVYLEARAEVRARRRLAQRGEPAAGPGLADETRRIQARDRADATRAAAPLRPADDAVRLDTSTLAFADQVQRIVDLVRRSPLPGAPDAG